MIEGVDLYHSSQIRACERLAKMDFSISEALLMDRAGRAAFQALAQFFPAAQKIQVYCGSGNNAGDGYVLARLAHEAGFRVIVYQYRLPIDLPPAAKEAALLALCAGVPCLSFDEIGDIDADLIVDGLLGTGLSKSVSGAVASVINHINASELPVLSLDVPSGLHADTGRAMGVAVLASLTVTFIAYKLGMMTLDGPDHCGKMLCNDLGLTDCLASIQPTAQVLPNPKRQPCLPKRRRNCNKKDFGHVLVIGGGEGMPGSVILSANAACRIGAGAVTIATKPQYASYAVAGLPETMIYGIENEASLEPLLERATVCVIGPGLGEDEWAQLLFKKAIASQLPIIIDAGALRILASRPQQDDNWILTPHPGEAAALLGCSTEGISEDRYHAVSLLQARFGGQVVLKGAGTLIRTDEPATWLCNAGNPGMATAGMGDVLSGVIAGLAAQGLPLREAAKQGVSLHARAADMAVEKRGERGLIASDLMDYLPLLVN